MLRFAVTYSKLNIAGKNIVEDFKKNYYMPQVPIIELKKETLYSELSVENYPELKNIDFLVFASTHRSEKGAPSLSLHAPGNWRSAKLGGEIGKVCYTSSFIMKYLFQELNKNYEENKSKLNEGYAITLEVTHHGPLTKIPCCFIEVGSSEEQWNDREATKIIAKTISSLQNYKENKKWIPTIGIGGPHYTPNFNKIQLNSDYAVGHIIPEYALPLTEPMLKEAEEKTKEQVKLVLVDWKGCGSSEQRKEVIKIIERTGLKYKRTKEIEKE